MKLEEI
ncbi:hypothetical protein D046_4462A, partial [Vibrio parahaemolyticus V-223/04]